MADLGTDIRCGALGKGIGKVFSLATGRENLGLAIARRLCTPRGGLFYDPDYGFDLRALLSKEMPKGAILAIGPQIESEATKDERVLSARADLSFDESSRKLTITLFLTDADGPFRLILAASAVTVELLEVG